MPLSTHPAKLIFCWISALLLPVMRGLRRGTGSLHWCGRFTGKFCAKKIISVVNIANKNTLGWPKKKKIKQAFTWWDTVFNRKKLYVHLWISPSFWWYFWHSLEMICVSVFFVLHSALVVLSPEKRCNLRREINIWKGIQFKRVHQKLLSASAEALAVVFVCSISHLLPMSPTFPSLSGSPDS